MTGAGSGTTLPEPLADSLAHILEAARTAQSLREAGAPLGFCPACEAATVASLEGTCPWCGTRLTQVRS